jgi:predicted DNA-binding protein
MPETRGKRIMTNVYLDPLALADLKRLSAHTRIPMAAYLREALEDLLKKHAKELRRTGR